MKVVRFDEPQEYHAPGQELRRVRIFIDEEVLGKKDITVGMSIYAPGMKAPFHTHEGSETMIIIHGRGRFGTREKSVEVGPGDVLYFEPKEEHYLENIGSQTLEFIFIYSKPGDEKPIKETWVPIKKEKK
ncbi:MAG: cupin domain-containing protein [Nitrososphaerota archaeon]